MVISFIKTRSVKIRYTGNVTNITRKIKQFVFFFIFYLFLKYLFLKNLAHDCTVALVTVYVKHF